jgi:site-specific DNA recombinase
MSAHHLRVAIYARVSSEQQAKEHTIASQIEVLHQRVSSDGEARYQVVAEEARVVRKVFEWVGQERCSIGEVCRRLRSEGVPTRTGKPAWDRATIWLMLKNPAYKGVAAFGKTRSGPLKPQRLRPQRGRPEYPRRPISRVDTSTRLWPSDNCPDRLQPT